MIFSEIVVEMVELPLLEPRTVALPDRQMPLTGRWLVLIGALQHSGDTTILFSALRGCKRSGDRARRNNGELGSALLGRANDFFATAPVGGPPGNVPGTYACVVLDDPVGCPAGKWAAFSRGLGDLVGDAGNGDGDGVRASGDNGMWPTDLRRFTACDCVLACNVLFVCVCSLCLSPCSVDGRGYKGAVLVVGVFGAEELGELAVDCDEFEAWNESSGDRLTRFVGGVFKDSDLANDVKLRLGVTIVGDCT